MNKTKQFTPTKGATIKTPKCQNVELEFCKRTLSLFTSYYEQQPVDEILKFPPVESDDSARPTEKKHAFNSTVLDLRVRRALENQSANIAAFNSDFEEKINSLSESLSKSVDLQNEFRGEQPEYPQKPLYIVNQEKDQEALDRLLSSHSKSINIAEVQKVFTSRLQKSKQKGEERAQQRISRIKEMATEDAPQYRTKTPKVESKTPTKRTRGFYEPIGGYKAFVNPKPKLPAENE